MISMLVISEDLDAPSFLCQGLNLKPDVSISKTCRPSALDRSLTKEGLEPRGQWSGVRRGLY